MGWLPSIDLGNLSQIGTGFIVGVGSAFLSSKLFQNLKKWIIRKLIFSKKNQRFIGETIDEGLDLIEKKDPVVGKATRAGVDELCDAIKKSIREKDEASIVK